MATSTPTAASAQGGEAAPAPGSGLAKVIEIVNTQIALVVGGLTGSVTAVSSALSMHLSELADAYSGRCPDQSTDVDPLDLNTDYVTLLDNLRRTRPKAYSLLAYAGRLWHDHPPALVDQPARMASHAGIIVTRLNTENAATHSTCTPAVTAAVAASLSTAQPPPPVAVPDSDVAVPDSDS